MHTERSIKRNSEELVESVLILLLIITATYLSISDQYGMIPGASHVSFFIHEFGHLIALSLPPLYIALAGTFLQLLVPIVFTTYFFLQRRFLEGAFFLCWLGTNLVYVGIYMKDTVYRTMPMANVFGPDAIHDWEYIFREFEVNLHAVEIGTAVVYLGWGVMLMSGVVVVTRLIKNCK